MKSSQIAKYINKELIGEDIEVACFSSLAKLQPCSVVFAKKYSKEYSELLNMAENLLAIVCEEYRGKCDVPHIISDNPRLDFLRIVSAFFVEKEIPTSIHPTAVVEDGAKIGKNVSIGAHCYIASKVTIGDNTTILPNTSIYGKVTIGSNCYVKSGVVIGGSGFGFEYDENEVPIHFPHTGEIIIGNDVYIGANTTIDRATIDATIIKDHVKIDNLVHIAHNCTVEENTLVIAGTILCGGVTVGKNSWISPNSSIHQKTRIGDHCTVGMGSVVLRKVKSGDTVFGNPAEKL